MIKFKIKIPLAFSLLLIVCALYAQPDGKFLPEDDKILFIIGQDMGAVGGFAAPNDNGYYENVAKNPGGITTYTDLPGHGGLKQKTNYGGGDVCAQCIIENPVYYNTTLSIGLYMVDRLEQINAGKLDKKIMELGYWIKHAQRPVFLRIGYEFDGVWNHYDPYQYVKAFRRIAVMFDSLAVDNCALVWQASTSPIDDLIEKKHEDIKSWYPGDEYVDWMGLSWFLNDSLQYVLSNELLNFARERAKPVMIAESTPQGYDIDELTKRNISPIYDGESGEGHKTKSAQEIWNEWFVPYFEFIYQNKDVIRAVAYINVNWDTQKLWGAPYNQGYWGDSRVQGNEMIKKQWVNEMKKNVWLHSTSQLFSKLGYEVVPSEGYKR